MHEGPATVAGGAKPAPLKRVLFNKPAWAKPQTIFNTEDLFHRPTYVNIRAEEELKRKRKEAKKKSEHSQKGDSSERQEKRRRLSDESESEDEQESSDDGGDVGQNQENEPAVDVEVPSPVKSVEPARTIPPPSPLEKSYEDTIASARAEAERLFPSNIIDLEEEGTKGTAISSDDEELVIAAVKRPEPSLDDDFSVSDEEFPELARKAREKERRKRLDADPAAKAIPEVRQEIAPGAEDLYQPDRQPTHLPQDPVVSILITSRLPGTEPLIATRRLGQRLKDVRTVWCQRQKFSPEFTQSIILTWRGKRLFDVTSCRSLGIAVDSDGNIVMKGERDVFGKESRQIQMEAMTEEMLEKMKREKERLEGDETPRDTAEEVLTEHPKQETQIRVILKAKDFDDFKLIVKPVYSTAGNFKTYTNDL